MRHGRQRDLEEGKEGIRSFRRAGLLHICRTVIREEAVVPTA